MARRLLRFGPVVPVPVVNRRVPERDPAFEGGADVGRRPLVAREAPAAARAPAREA